MLQYASSIERITALLFDCLIFLAVFIFFLIFIEMDENGRFSFFGSFFSFPVLIFWLIYFPLSEGLSGQTLGKRIMKIRVVALERDNLTLWQALVRRLFDLVDMLFFGLVGILLMSRSDKTQRLGDSMAGTIVIKYNEIACVNCGTKCLLTVEELQKGQFTCPDCGHINN